jgi:hypothetical protein
MIFPLCKNALAYYVVQRWRCGCKFTSRTNGSCVTWIFLMSKNGRCIVLLVTGSFLFHIAETLKHYHTYLGTSSERMCSRHIQEDNNGRKWIYVTSHV